jgi:hypothetical protein
VLRASGPTNAFLMSRHSYSAGRMWISAPGPASPVLGGSGVTSGFWDPGLTSYSADAVSGCPPIDLSAGIPDFRHPPACRSDLPGLGRGRGFTGSDGQRVRATSSTREKRWHGHCRDSRHYRRRGYAR